jgi:5-methylcytosine-specific restriction endonuclease McrA
MSKNRTQSDSQRLDRVVAEARRDQEERERGYRAQALKILPWTCAHCEREFSGKRLRELTVHHKDHNHENNPADGSNWELLCIYCHENQHSRLEVADAYAGVTPAKKQESVSTYKPFSQLEALLTKKTEKPPQS